MTDNNFDQNVIELECTKKHGRFFDVILICNDSCYGAHKFILAMQSNYLKESFLTIAREIPNNQDPCKIMMDDLKEIDLENILNYIYYGEIGVTKQDVCGFLQAGKFLQLDTLTELMEENVEFNLKSQQFQKKFGTINLSHNIHKLTPIKEAGRKKPSLSPIKKRTFESMILNEDFDESNLIGPISLGKVTDSPLSSTRISRTRCASKMVRLQSSLEDISECENSNENIDRSIYLDPETAAFSAETFVDSNPYKSMGLSI